MRSVAVILLLISAGFIVLWQLNVINLQPRSQSHQSRASQGLFEAIQNSDLVALKESIDSGGSISAQDQDGLTPLMHAAINNQDPTLIFELIALGADLDAQDNLGTTALMHAARDNRNPEILLTLLNASANPTITDNEDRTLYEYASENSILRRSRLYQRFEGLVSSPFDSRWPSGYTVPIEGARFTSRKNHLPNQPRPYRNGVHQGFDFFSRVITIPIDYGTPVRSVASGQVVRADHSYVEMTKEEYDGIISDARSQLTTPERSLDKLRGRQVWVEHVGGYVSRYAHLQGIPTSIQEGGFVSLGQVIGYIGNSGTIEAAQNTQDEPHLHFEIWDSEGYMGENFEAQQIYNLIAQVFGQDVLPLEYID